MFRSIALKVATVDGGRQVCAIGLSERQISELKASPHQQLFLSFGDNSCGAEIWVAFGPGATPEGSCRISEQAAAVLNLTAGLSIRVSNPSLQFL
ncbi:MAG: hypothetical protein WAN50_00620 [Minisyncoccia bacterium]